MTHWNNLVDRECQRRVLKTILPDYEVGSNTSLRDEEVQTDITGDDLDYSNFEKLLVSDDYISTFSLAPREESKLTGLELANIQSEFGFGFDEAYVVPDFICIKMSQKPRILLKDSKKSITITFNSENLDREEIKLSMCDWPVGDFNLSVGGYKIFPKRSTLLPEHVVITTEHRKFSLDETMFHGIDPQIAEREKAAWRLKEKKERLLLKRHSESLSFEDLSESEEMFSWSKNDFVPMDENTLDLGVEREKYGKESGCSRTGTDNKAYSSCEAQTVVQIGPNSTLDEEKVVRSRNNPLRISNFMEDSYNISDFAGKYYKEDGEPSPTNSRIGTTDSSSSIKGIRSSIKNLDDKGEVWSDEYNKSDELQKVPRRGKKLSSKKELRFSGCDYSSHTLTAETSDLTLNKSESKDFSNKVHRIKSYHFGERPKLRNFEDTDQFVGPDIIIDADGNVTSGEELNQIGRADTGFSIDYELQNTSFHLPKPQQYKTLEEMLKMPGDHNLRISETLEPQEIDDLMSSKKKLEEPVEEDSDTRSNIEDSEFHKDERAEFMSTSDLMSKRRHQQNLNLGDPDTRNNIQDSQFHKDKEGEFMPTSDLMSKRRHQQNPNLGDPDTKNNIQDSQFHEDKEGEFMPTSDLMSKRQHQQNLNLGDPDTKNNIQDSQFHKDKEGEFMPTSDLMSKRRLQQNLNLEDPDTKNNIQDSQFHKDEEREFRPTSDLMSKWPHQQNTNLVHQISDNIITEKSDGKCSSDLYQEKCKLHTSNLTYQKAMNGTQSHTDQPNGSTEGRSKSVDTSDLIKDDNEVMISDQRSTTNLNHSLLRALEVVEEEMSPLRSEFNRLQAEFRDIQVEPEMIPLTSDIPTTSLSNEQDFLKGSSGKKAKPDFPPVLSRPPLNEYERSRALRLGETPRELDSSQHLCSCLSLKDCRQEDRVPGIVCRKKLHLSKVFNPHASLREIQEELSRPYSSEARNRTSMLSDPQDFSREPTPRKNENKENKD